MGNDNSAAHRLLADFFSAIRGDQRVRPTHIGLYATLVHCWHLQDHPDCLAARPEEIMRWAKISAISTYLRYLRELDAFGYIRYTPSYSPRKGSRIRLTGPAGRAGGNRPADASPHGAGEKNAP